ncbi:MAG: hypothetical protein J3K34DRAFT_151779 [Monoraphidium minutum]|nr:MAG: hypothetical protein J3K34DRAFT_151779 [Monoraphidium minutum]
MAGTLWRRGRPVLSAAAAPVRGRRRGPEPPPHALRPLPTASRSAAPAGDLLASSAERSSWTGYTYEQPWRKYKNRDWRLGQDAGHRTRVEHGQGKRERARGKARVVRKSTAHLRGSMSKAMPVQNARARAGMAQGGILRVVPWEPPRAPQGAGAGRRATGLAYAQKKRNTGAQE